MTSYFDYLPKEIGVLIINYIPDEDRSLENLYDSDLVPDILNDPKFFIERIRLKLPLVNMELLKKSKSFKGLYMTPKILEEELMKFVYKMKLESYQYLRVLYNNNGLPSVTKLEEDYPISTSFSKDVLKLLNLDEKILDDIYDLSLSSELLLRLVFKFNNGKITFRIYIIDNGNYSDYSFDGDKLELHIPYAAYFNMILFKKQLGLDY